MPRTVIPFATGIHQETDPKMLPEGNLRSIKNLRIRRGSQLGVRFGYTALGLTTQNGLVQNSIIASDVIESNGRLLALASTDGSSAPNDLVEYVGEPQEDWRHSLSRSVFDSGNQRRLNSVENVRNLGRLQLQPATNPIEVVDVAAAAGRVCVVSIEASAVTVQLVRASDDTLLSIETFGGTHGRVVAVGSKFFIVYRSGSVFVPGDLLQVRTLDPDTAVGITPGTIISSTAGLTSFDLALRATPADGFVTAEARGTTVTVRRFDSTATEELSYSVTGPAASTVSVIESASVPERTSLAIKDNGGTGLTLTTFIASTGTLESGPTALGDANTFPDAQQVGLASIAGTTEVGIFSSRSETSGPTVHGEYLLVNTHASSASLYSDRLWSSGNLSTRPIALPGTQTSSEESILFGAVVADSNGAFSTNLLQEWYPADMTVLSLDRSLAFPDVSLVQLASVALDLSTGKYYWPHRIVEIDGACTVVVSEFDAAKSQRRQSASVNGELYLAGGAPQLFDSRLLVEAGYLRPPVVLSVVESGNFGLLTALATYQLVFVWEWHDSQGKLHESEPSDVFEVTLTGTNSRITSVVQGPLSQRYNNSNSRGLTLQLVVYRTLPAPDTQLHRDVFFFQTGNTTGAAITVNSARADDDLAEQGIVYTQGATGARSGPNPFVSPQPCSYIWASADKLLTGGLPDPSQIQESRAAFPNEPITWAANLGGVRGIRADVLAVASLDERRIVFTADEVFQVDGEGLDINGVGDLGAPRKLPSAVGLHGGRDGWKSLVESDAGLFFQGVTRLIYMLPRGGGAPVEVGAAVQDTLELFPNISAATYCQEDQTVCFACNNAAGDDSVILTFDISEGQWSLDEEPGGVLSIVHHNGRLVVLRDDQTIHRQNLTHPAAAFVDTEIVTGTIHPFAPGVEGDVDQINWIGEYRGDSVLTCYLSNADGGDEQNLGSKVLSNREPGATVTLSWHPDVMVGNRFRIRFTCTEENGASEGVRHNYAVLHSSSNRTPMLTNDRDHA